MNGYAVPPRWALRILRAVCPGYLYEEIEGDLIQKFHRDIKVSDTSKVSDTYAIRRAKRRFIWNAIRFFRPGIILRNRFSTRLNGLFGNAAPTQRTISFQRVNNFTGWLVFSVALTTYLLTVEETASLWDCGEFIAASYKLQVPHPPGAPLFLLLGRLFSFASFGDVTKIAYSINLMSALASAFTILFLFWSIVLVGRKMVDQPKDRVLTNETTWLLMGAGVVGSLAYCFSDSFWFSAVEAEVYAMSSFFTAFVVWGVLKWERLQDKSHANRWLILLAYVIGLSIGVHLLNLLTLPALALIYYFKTYKSSTAGIVVTLALSGAMILFINDFIVPGLPTIAGAFEIFFVNKLGLFFGSGAVTFALALIGMLTYGIYYTQRKNYVGSNTFLLATTFILIGYGSYAVVVIRSDYDTPINENAPKDVMSFVRYLKREQYGSRPLLYGPYFTSNAIDYKYGAAVYVKGKDHYEISDRKFDHIYPPGEETILPRAWDKEQKNDYERIMNLREGQRPTFTQNMLFMFKHQIGTMYMRYFMWNFAGRESDIQGANWLAPSEWFKKIPSELATNKGRNNFYMIPFILGLIGMFYQFVKDTKNFIVITLLFIMLGVAIAFYLNSPPAEPRERDYIYAGSYYAFTFWIGLAVIALADVINRILESRKTVVLAASLIGLIAPVLLVYEDWNDHDRSNRFFSTDSAANSLESCGPNGVIFTGGDNDTFPLWYAQEAEGRRTDLRVLVLSYCNTDWYIDQTTRKAYNSEPFNYTLGPKEYRQGGLNDVLFYVDAKIKSIDAKQYLNLLAKNYPSLRNGDSNILPSRMITLDVNRRDTQGIIPKGMENLVVDQLQLKLLGNVLEKRDLAFLDLLVTNNWKRPIYLNNTSLSQMHLDVSPYVVQEGNAYRILPVKNPRKDRPYLVDTNRSYDLMLHTFRYRGLNDPHVYYNDDYKIQVLSHRSNLNSLAQALIDEGNMEKANEVLMFSLAKMPDEAVQYDPSAPDTVKLLFKVGQREKAVEIANVVGNRSAEMASYLISEGGAISFELRKDLFLISAMQRNLCEYGENAIAEKLGEKYDRLLSDLQNSMDSGRATE